MPAASTTIALLLADARLPSGGHVSSNGLETALRSGMHPDRVRGYMRTRLETVVLVEAGVAVVARHAVVSAEPNLLGRLDEIDREWAARTPSAALREFGRALGAGLSRLAAQLWPAAPLPAGHRWGRATVLGAVAGVAGLAADDLVRVVAYDDAQTVAAALLKLEPRDPAVPARWVLEACTQFEPRVALLCAISRPEAIPAAGAPQIEEWAQAHSTLSRRLFRA